MRVRLAAAYPVRSDQPLEEFINENEFPAVALLLDNLGGIFEVVHMGDLRFDHDYWVIKIGEELVAVYPYEIELAE